jgi:hypothetical protein
MSPKGRALVIVFGDVAQSPRMLNHARSLDDAGYQVDIIGYARGKGLRDGTPTHLGHICAAWMQGAAALPTTTCRS